MRLWLRPFAFASADPAAAYYFVVLIEDGGLAGSDGSLRLVEDGVDLVVAVAVQGGCSWDVTMSNLDGDAEFFALVEIGDGDPVEAVGVEVAREEIVVGAYGDLVGVWVDGQDVEWVGRGQAETLALAYGEALDALVVADDFAGGGDEFACGVGEGLMLLFEVGLEEGVVVATGDKADFLGVGLGGYVESGFGGHDADGWLLHLA